MYVKNAQLRAEGKDTLTDMRGTEPNTTYKDYLRKYVNEARDMGVTPILMAPICRAYFKDGKINNEGRHNLTTNDQVPTTNKDYVRCMREVAEEMNVPFLDMTGRSQSLYEQMGQKYCMEHYFNCGDKTHTGQEGGMAIATLAYRLIKTAPELAQLHPLIDLPPMEYYGTYCRAIEEKGKSEAFAAKGKAFSRALTVTRLQNMEQTKSGYVPTGGMWPAGEVDEVANRYVEYKIAAEKKKGLVVETIVLPVKAIGGAGMNLHINYGFGDSFRDVTTVFENTALPKGKKVSIELKQPILVPAGETLYLRVLPWYDSNGRPQGKKYIQIEEMQISGKRLM